MDNDPRTTAELKTEMVSLFKEYLEWLAPDCSAGSITMTDATESIYGSSGRGSQRAVRILETLRDYGYLQITGNRRRRVAMTDKGRTLVGS